jgi:hypothetical protein
MKNELYNVLSGKSQVRYGAIIQTIANHLKESSFTGSRIENEQYVKKEDETIYAVVRQSFVTVTQTTDLDQVKLFLTSNGFENTRNNDYYNPELGIILEDLHDENVLTQNDVLYFIDTVFYLTDSFWNE